MEDFAEDGVGGAGVGDEEGLVGVHLVKIFLDKDQVARAGGGNIGGGGGAGLFTILDRWMAESEMLILELSAKSLANWISPAVKPAFRILLFKAEVACARSAFVSGRD